MVAQASALPDFNEISAPLKDGKSSTGEGGDFLTSLLKDSPKDLFNLLKSFTKDIDELKNLLEKMGKDDKIKKDILKLLQDMVEEEFSNEKIEPQLKLDTPKDNETATNQNDKKNLSPLEELLNLDKSDNKENLDKELQIVNQILNKEIEVPKNQEKEVFKIVQKIITSKQIIQQLPLKEKEINDLKNAKSLDDIIKLSKKFNLNLSKISIKKSSLEIQNPVSKKLPTDLPMFDKEIAKEAFKSKIENQVKKTTEQNTQKNHIEVKSALPDFNNENETTAPKSLLADILSKNAKKEEKRPEIKLKENSKNSNDNILGTLLNSKDDNKKIKKNEDSNSNHHFGSSSNPNIINELKANQVLAKESLKQFSSKLHEAIQDYKAPMSRLSLELHPKELGKVEVTITHRGDNIHIQVNSNNMAVGFLNSQQDNLRQALTNLGYSDVNMSFNSNGKEQQNREAYKQNQKKLREEEEDELIIEIPMYA